MKTSYDRHPVKCIAQQSSEVTFIIAVKLRNQDLGSQIIGAKSHYPVALQGITFKQAQLHTHCIFEDSDQCVLSAALLYFQHPFQSITSRTPATIPLQWSVQSVSFLQSGHLLSPSVTQSSMQAPASEQEASTSLILCRDHSFQTSVPESLRISPFIYKALRSGTRKVARGQH